MLNIVLKQLRKIQFVADWLAFREAKLESQKLSARHQTGLEEARKRNADRREYETINGQYQAESELIWHPIYVRQSERLIAQARKYGVSVPALPVSYQEDSDDWIVSTVTGDWFLSGEAEERLKRDIRAERRQSNDEFRKWATVIFAGLAFMLGIVSILARSKQPDPCPKNYYRSDSGECVFALQKPIKPGPQQQIAPKPPTSPVQQKPSPAHP